MYINSGVMRSNRLDIDFELLLKSQALFFVVDDGFGTDTDQNQGVFGQKKSQLATRYQDFKDCLDFLDHSDLQFRKSINKKWGTSDRLLKIAEKHLCRPISHGALLLALDLRGMRLYRIDDQKDAFMSISALSMF